MLSAIIKMSYARIKYLLLSIAFVCAVLTSCEGQKDKLNEKEFNQKYGEKLICVNKELVKKDEDAINSFIKRRHWNMTKTGTGLFYEVYKSTGGEKAVAGQRATIDFKIWLLDGTLCYSSEKTGPKTFTISQGGVESGLEEGILLMGVGDKAHFILPPYLAHGLVGDDDKIPPRSIIIYDVELLSISK